MRIRCFIAIKTKPVKQYFDYLTKIKEEYNVRIKVVNPENYHFTLHFFGEIPIEDVNKIDESLQILDIDKFEFNLSGTGSFPGNKLKQTKVLFVDTNLGRNSVIKVASTIHELLKSLEFQVQTRKFIPHLTVCRVRSGAEIGDLTQAWLDEEFDDVAMECSELVLIKSTLTPTGSVYTTLYEYKLN
ncbi:MAG: RNA 2',3'-cyclic phosphodiesterase [Candidatus Heimdallarchaeota archaeon]|nr:RNA 2',3'-cyclic phosphodiesterase [Candidatus Heimdallarchaeota archaeon]